MLMVKVKPNRFIGDIDIILGYYQEWITINKKWKRRFENASVSGSRYVDGAFSIYRDCPSIISMERESFYKRICSKCFVKKRIIQFKNKAFDFYHKKAYDIILWAQILNAMPKHVSRI